MASEMTALSLVVEILATVGLAIAFVALIAVGIGYYGLWKMQKHPDGKPKEQSQTLPARNSVD